MVSHSSVLSFFFFFIFLGSPLLPQSEYLFSPHGNITKRIIEEIEKAETEIIIAIYMITSEKIVHALITAKKRGVNIKMVTDSGCVQSPYGKIFHLLKAGIEVKMFSPQTKNKKFPPLMHAKYAVIDKKICIEGSFNWTNSAEIWNAEHVRITNNKQHKEALCAHFLKLFNECSTTDFVCHPAQEEKWNKKNALKEKMVEKQLAADLKKAEKERLKIAASQTASTHQIITLLKKKIERTYPFFQLTKEA
jgi:cardiolipin hydrolase